MSKYTPPSDLHLPSAGGVSGEAHVLGLLLYRRLWLAVFALATIALSLGVTQCSTEKSHTPSVVYVTLDGGYPVIWNERGNLVIDSLEYVPARFQEVVNRFVDYRYAYDWQDPQKINSAFRYMSAEAAQSEEQKFIAINPGSRILGMKTKVKLDLNQDWKVVPGGDGRFAVKISGRALVTDLQHPDPQHPLALPVEIDLTVQTVPASSVNPLGYQIVSTGKDIL